MIYIVSDNYFLFNGIKEIMLPKKIKLMKPNYVHDELLRSLSKEDILLIDTGPCCNDITDLLLGEFNKFRIVFMNRIKKNTVNPHLIRSVSNTLNSDVSLTEFHDYILKALAGDVPSENINAILTKREEIILRDSLRGLTTQAIADSLGVNVKTVYTHRSNACHKLGVNKITDALPFITWFTSRSDNTGGNALIRPLKNDNGVLRDNHYVLTASPFETNIALYQKIMHTEIFGQQKLTSADLRYLFNLVHDACQSRAQFMSWSVMEDLMNITFEALIYATENGISVDRYEVDQAFHFSSQHYRAEIRTFMANLPHSIDAGYAEVLLSPLCSGALYLEAFPDEVLAIICTPARLKRIFPLLVWANNQGHSGNNKNLATFRPVLPSGGTSVRVEDICLQLTLLGNADTFFPGGRYIAPSLTLQLNVGRFTISLGWEMVCETLRLFQARAWLGVEREWTHQGHHVGIDLAYGETDEVILRFDGLRMVMTGAEYARLEAGLLAAVAEPPMAKAIAQLRALFGDL